MSFKIASIHLRLAPGYICRKVSSTNAATARGFLVSTGGNMAGAGMEEDHREERGGGPD
jgi:hypothetical protein